MHYEKPKLSYIGNINQIVKGEAENDNNEAQPVNETLRYYKGS